MSPSACDVAPPAQETRQAFRPAMDRSRRSPLAPTMHRGDDLVADRSAPEPREGWGDLRDGSPPGTIRTEVAQRMSRTLAKLQIPAHAGNAQGQAPECHPLGYPQEMYAGHPAHTASFRSQLPGRSPPVRVLAEEPVSIKPRINAGAAVAPAFESLKTTWKIPGIRQVSTDRGDGRAQALLQGDPVGHLAET